MIKSLDVRCPINPLAITDRHINNLQVLSGSAEEQVEVAEGIEIAKVRTVCCYARIVSFPQHLGPAQCILYRLSEKPGKCKTKTLVTDQVEEPHRAVLHWIYEAYAVDEFTAPRQDRLEEAR